MGELRIIIYSLMEFLQFVALFCLSSMFKQLRVQKMHTFHALCIIILFWSNFDTPEVDPPFFIKRLQQKMGTNEYLILFCSNMG
jgi:hypothetical protein